MLVSKQSKGFKWLTGPVHAFDQRAIHLMRQAEHTVLNPVMGLISATGEPWTLYPLSGVVGLWWVRQRRPGDSLTLGAALVGSAALSNGLKWVVERPRPRFKLPRVRSSGSSFPSQHLAMSVAAYGMLAYLVTRRHRGRRWRLGALVLAWCLLMSWSRVYQGVHYPSDVLGGWIVGLLWLALCGVAHQQLVAGRAVSRG